MNKRLTTALAALFLACSTILPAHAAELAPQIAEAEAMTLSISPHWIAINQISHGVTFNGSTANVSSNCYAWYSNYKVYITVTLQKINGVSISNLKSWSSNGTGSAHVSETYSVDRGSYRVQTSVTVYDASGNHVESVTDYSNIKVY